MKRLRLVFFLSVVFFIIGVSMFYVQAYHYTAFRINDETPPYFSEFGANYTIENRIITDPVSLSGYDTVVIRNSVINYGGTSNTFSVSDSDRIILENNTFIDTESVYLSGNVISISRNVFTRNRPEECEIFINSSLLTFSENTISHLFGVFINGSAFTMSNNLFNGIGGQLSSGVDTIYINNTRADSVISQNLFHYDKDASVITLQNSTDVLITQNTFYDVFHRSSNPSVSITQYTSANITFTRNYFHSEYILDFTRTSLPISSIVSFSDNFYFDYKDKYIFATVIDDHYNVPYEVWKNDSDSVSDGKPLVSLGNPSIVFIDNDDGVYKWKLNSTYGLPERKFSVYINDSLTETGSWLPYAGFPSITDFSYDVGLGMGKIDLEISNGFANASFSDRFNYIAPLPTDFTPPIISRPDDIRYKFGTEGHKIVWGTIEDHPYIYEIFINGSSQGKHEWETDVISYSIDGWEIGTYIVKIVFTDLGFNQVSDEVMVVVYTDYSPYPALTVWWSTLESVFTLAGTIGIVMVIREGYRCNKRGGEFRFGKGYCEVFPPKDRT